ncbi:MAG: hypothetical protein L6Q71_12445, partial [Planctomycetes bacterium]|nr:hypothetical protein [Planctomycetota bacterium]
SQTGYRAISLAALNQLDLNSIYPRYGVPNDILVKLNIAGMRVGEVPVNPLYGVGEASKMRPARVAYPILKLLFKLWLKRIFARYVVQNGHPIVGVLAMAFVALSLMALTTIYILVETLRTEIIPKAALIVDGFAFVTSMQFFLSAMHMDYQYNEELCVRLEGPAHKNRRRSVVSHQHWPKE